MQESKTMAKVLFPLIALLCLSISSAALSQDLLGERIRKLQGRKKSVYLDRGIFHNGSPKKTSTLKAIRHSYTEGRGYERLVFDFTTNKIPRVYGYFAGKKKKLYIDFFNTNLTSGIGSFGNSHFVESVNFFPIEKDDVSLEVIFKEKVSVEIFYLSNHGRLVVDIKS